MTAYMIATIAVKDPVTFQTYLAETQRVAAPYGARLVFRGQTAQALTGDPADHGIVVVVEFPSHQKLDEWYRSDAYRPLIPLREEAADMTMVSYIGMD